jgi:hypothetical protein
VQVGAVVPVAPGQFAESSSDPADVVRHVVRLQGSGRSCGLSYRGTPSAAPGRHASPCLATWVPIKLRKSGHSSRLGREYGQRACSGGYLAHIESGPDFWPAVSVGREPHLPGTVNQAARLGDASVRRTHRDRSYDLHAAVHEKVS